MRLDGAAELFEAVGASSSTGAGELAVNGRGGDDDSLPALSTSTLVVEGLRWSALARMALAAVLLPANSSSCDVNGQPSLFQKLVRIQQSTDCSTFQALAAKSKYE